MPGCFRLHGSPRVSVRQRFAVSLAVRGWRWGRRGARLRRGSRWRFGPRQRRCSACSRGRTFGRGLRRGCRLGRRRRHPLRESLWRGRQQAAFAAAFGRHDVSRLSRRRRSARRRQRRRRDRRRGRLPIRRMCCHRNVGVRPRRSPIAWRVFLIDHRRLVGLVDTRRWRNDVARRPQCARLNRIRWHERSYRDNVAIACVDHNAHLVTLQIDGAQHIVRTTAYRTVDGIEMG